MGSLLLRVLLQALPRLLPVLHDLLRLDWRESDRLRGRRRVDVPASRARGDNPGGLREPRPAVPAPCIPLPGARPAVRAEARARLGLRMRARFASHASLRYRSKTSSRWEDNSISRFGLKLRRFAISSPFAPSVLRGAGHPLKVVHGNPGEPRTLRTYGPRWGP